MNELLQEGYFGFMYLVPTGINIATVALFILIMGYRGAPLWLWTVFTAAVFWGLAAPAWLWIVVGAVLLIFNIVPLRRAVVTVPIMKLAEAIGFLPTISASQRIALEAGSTWVEGEFFTGKPDLDKLKHQKYPKLSEKEQAFLDNQVEELCNMQSDWSLQEQKDLNAETWAFIRQERFLGMVIPEKYGGLGFSGYGMNTILSRIGSRSVALAVDVMVPNSLGPAELLMNYGTDKQKDHYLPRLAEGKEIPCFALTEPDAGSDAEGLHSEGVVFKGEDGELYIRLNWEKRYITLAAIATLLGLAFKLKDPDNLLGKGTDPGITCGLIPTNLEGVVLGRRHDPLKTYFINSPTEGHDVVVSVDQIIGGPEQAGNGWRMLMETLAGGRAIFLPALYRGGSQYASMVVSNFAVVRQQFGLHIGKFEAIEELMAPMGAYTWSLDAINRYTCGGVDEGRSSSVVSAMVKYNCSEFNRTIVNHAMDLMAGSGIVLGPRNLMGQAHMAVPIGITVEGSNVVTRSLITFGQGLISAHPFALKELNALEEKDAHTFDRVFWSHMRMIFRNLFRGTLLNLTRGYLSGPIGSPMATYYRKLNWASTNFAFMADLALGTLGGGLKKKEKLSGRYADILSWLYISACVLHKYEQEGHSDRDKLFATWMLENAFSEIQRHFLAIYSNLPVPLIGGMFKSVIALWARLNPFGHPPSDKLSHKIAGAMQTDQKTREHLFADVFMPHSADEPLNVLNQAYRSSLESLDIYKKIRAGSKQGKIDEDRPKLLIEQAFEAGVITKAEYDQVQKTNELRRKAIAVDDFTLEQLPVNTATPQKTPEPQKTETK